MICRYWWNQQEGKRKIHWLSWEKMILPKKLGGMGFRDIYAFNLAMLVKQGWRLIRNPDSLCACVLQAKYFSGTSCLKAQAKSSMSYTWRSILKGIELLKKGIIWRVGDGIPVDLTRRPITPRGSTMLSYVSELINPVTGQWDRILINDLFWEEDARVILALPVHEGREDVLAWHFDRLGRFSVKSAYKLYRDDIMRTRSRTPASSSSGCNSEKGSVWSKIWGLMCPNMIKHFLWRLSHNSHALRVNLERHRMKVDTKCVVCQRVDEDGAHLFSNVKK